MMLTIKVDQERCTKCGRCVDACPVPCFSFNEDETEILINPEGCLVCRNCEEECPRHCVAVVFPYRSTVSYF
jgi:NAD-dependent dihydropyrimidine dehydrogenase PreA subunit